MAHKGETRLQRRIQAALKKEFNLFVMKIHGSDFQRAGFPDLLVCCAGLFFAFEVKMPRGKVSDVQHEVMREIRAAGGYAKVIEDAETAIHYMRRILEKENRLLEAVKTAATRSRRVHRRTSLNRTLLQAAPRKNVYRRRRY